jgi:transforming growth factor-beta-induced protein
MNKILSVSIVVLLAALVLAACAPAATLAPTATQMPPTMAPAATATTAPTATSAPTATPKPQTIVDVAVAAGNFKTLVAALKATGLDKTLAGEGPFTVFAPTDDAFAKLPAGTLDTLLKPENKDKLVQILTYHVVPGKLTAADLSKLSYANTVANLSLSIKADMGKVIVNDANVTQADVMASNGVIHVIDTVLLPRDIVDTVVADGRFKTLTAALKAAGLVDTLKGKGPFTVFAPTDDAFAKLPAGTLDTLLKPENKDKLAQILTYHVVPAMIMSKDINGQSYVKTLANLSIDVNASSGKVMVNDALVTQSDILATNGVIHVIDTVLLPRDIVDTVVADGRFTTLTAALKAAGLVDTLKGNGPFTVFAPTDDAFAKLPAGTLDTLLKPENKDKLTQVLTYHVVSGNLLAADLAKLTTAKTLNGKEVTIKVDGDKVFINDAQVIIADILCTNGVIHVIDTVLIP